LHLENNDKYINVGDKKLQDYKVTLQFETKVTWTALRLISTAQR